MRMIRKLQETKYYWQVIAWIFSLGMAACVGVAVITRFLAFWTMARSMKLLIIVLIMLALVLPIYLLRKIFKRCWLIYKDSKEMQGLATFALAGSVVWLLFLILFVPIPASHTFTIESLPTDNAVSAQTVEILEIRGPDGQFIQPEKFSLSGDWNVARQGLSVSGRKSAKLTYTFYTSNGKELQVLVQKVPEGGQALFKVDSTSEQVSFRSEVKDQQIYVFALSDVNRWAALIWTVDFVVTVGLIYIILFVVSFYAWALHKKVFLIKLKLPFSYEMVFIVVFFILLMAPLYNYTDRIENFESRFTFRTKLLYGWSDFRFQVLGDRMFKKLIVGKGNWLVYTGEESLNDYQNTLLISDDDLAGFQSALDCLHDRLMEKGITFLVVVVPNKNTIYPEFIPPQIPVLGKESFLDRLLDFQKLHGKAQILDLRPALLEARQERQVYYATDTHWNSYGALVGYQEMLRALQKEYPSLQPHPLEDYDFIDEGLRNGGMTVELGQVTVKERYFHLNLKDPSQVYSWESKGTDILNPKGFSIITTARPDTSFPKLVMYRDSFSSWMTPFLKDHFSRAVFLWTFQIDENFIDTEKPDIVVIQVNERYLFQLMQSLKLINMQKNEDGGLSLNE